MHPAHEVYVKDITLFTNWSPFSSLLIKSSKHFSMSLTGLHSFLDIYGKPEVLDSFKKN